MTNGQGRPLDLPNPEPWSEPVDGIALLSKLALTIREYVILSDPQADAIALWSVVSHVFEGFDTAPKLHLQSAFPRSGKTRLCEVLKRLVRKPLLVSGISSAALLRIIEGHAPTILLDEIDAAMKGNAEMKEALRGIINSGFDREGARFVKNVPSPNGKGWEPHDFSTWCPQLLAGIGKVPDTVADRSIKIDMKRRKRDERVKRLRSRDGDDLRALGCKATRWAADNLASLRDANPEPPKGLHDRAADAWAPLLAIADRAGGAWPKRSRKAAIELTGADDEEAETAGIALLGDIRAILGLKVKDTDRTASKELVAALLALAERLWAEFKRGKPPTQT